MPTWWARPAAGQPATDASNPLLLGDEDEEGGGLSPRTPPLSSHDQPALHPPPRPLRLRALAAGFRASNAGLALAGAGAVASAYALARSAAPIPPGPAIIALASVGTASALTGALGASLRASTSPRGVSNCASAVGAVVLLELIGLAALWASGAIHLPPGLPPGRAPATAAAVAACQITSLAMASLLGPVALRAEEGDLDAASPTAAAEGWASPLRWGAPSVGATPARRPRPSPSSTPPLTTPPPALDADGVAWRARMRERYGLDTDALFTYDPARRAAEAGRGGGGGGGGGRGGGAGGAAAAESARRCAVM